MLPEQANNQRRRERKKRKKKKEGRKDKNRTDFAREVDQIEVKTRIKEFVS